MSAGSHRWGWRVLDMNTPNPRIEIVSVHGNPLRPRVIVGAKDVREFASALVVFGTRDRG